MSAIGAFRVSREWKIREEGIYASAGAKKEEEEGKNKNSRKN